MLFSLQIVQENAQGDLNLVFCVKPKHNQYSLL